MNLHRRLSFAAALLCCGFLLAPYNAAQSYNPSLWSGMKYRMIGPERGGRVTTVTGVPSQPHTFYMGSTGGGVWKTTDAGATWVNVSDGYFKAASMGAVEVSLSNPDVVYAGTGSSKIRSNVSIGRGIYKSTDAGKSWTFAGLRDTGQISTVRVDPGNPDIVYVAALGNPFVPNKERGIFRSTDGGKTWKNVLFVSDQVGAADLEIQPGHPKVLFACMWLGRRKPWTIISGGHADRNEGGIYKSTDGGETWSKLGGGLPHELFGRANVAISNSKPDRIYALVEAAPGGGLYRSEDAGATWSLVNGSQQIITRPFYYDTLGVDPVDSNVVWVGNETWFKSTDGGKTMRRSPVPHGDNHDVWINPRDPQIMIQSNDGGANVSLDGGRTWSTQTNQPTAEIYQVAIDNQYPYRVYGAQQDNTTVIVPSRALGDREEDFRVGPGCETGPIMPNLNNPEIVYGGCKGQFSVQNMNTTNEMRYWVGAESLYGNGGDTLMYRFQRVSPMEVSPFDQKTVYYGSQFVHRSRDSGVTWEKISPDLTAHPAGTQGPSGEPITRDATGEEVYSTLYSIRESPVKRGVIWAGSNDGPIWVTRDDGKTWANVTPPMEPGGRVQNIEPSPHKEGTAYAAIYRYLLGDFAPYIFRTDDFGKTWTRLTDGKNGIAADEPTRVVREDPGRAGLLFAGTEFGMYVSFDNGGHWQSFQMNLPVSPVTDIKLAHGDLILSTQGRSFWILDDLSPLHKLRADSASQTAILYPVREQVRTPGRGNGGEGGLGRRSGVQFPPAGATFSYYLANASAEEIRLDILDASGKTIRTISSVGSGGGREEAADAAPPDAAPDEEGGFRFRGAPVRLDKSAGMHRVTWDLRYPGAWVSETRPDGPNGPMAVPGKYAVKLTVGSWTATESFTLIEDPRVTKSGVTTADLQEQFDHNMRVRDLVSDANKLVARVRAAQRGPNAAAVAKLADALITSPIRYSQPKLQTHITYLYSVTTATDQKIGRDVIERYGVLRKQLDELIKQADAVLK